MTITLLVGVLKRSYAVALCCLALGASDRSLAADTYQIEAASNDEHFIINGEKFSAKTYCIGWDEGDIVIFVSGSPYGACTSATLYNLSRRQKCEVWCE